MNLCMLCLNELENKRKYENEHKEMGIDPSTTINLKTV